MAADVYSNTVVILSALDVEYKAVRAALSGWRMHRHPAGTLFEQCPLPGTGWSVVIARTGAGNQGAAVLAERAISQFQPRIVLFVGVAGALHDDLQLGDVTVGTKIYAYQSGKSDDDGFHARPTAWPAAHELDQLAHHVKATTWTSRTDRDDDPPAVHFRPIAAGDVVLNSKTTPVAEQLSHHYDDAAAIEMESAGAASAGHHNHSRPVLTIRGISDKADGAKYRADRAGWQPVAAANAAAFAYDLVQAYVAQLARWIPQFHRNWAQPGPSALHATTARLDPPSPAKPLAPRCGPGHRPVGRQRPGVGRRPRSRRPTATAQRLLVSSNRHFAALYRPNDARRYTGP